ncbi:MAG TPA: CTP synthase [Candidatus Magasanikbacteria bacterium]|nr:CTP synthase [Candidatus Magasanikbacteria bacterium]
MGRTKYIFVVGGVMSGVGKGVTVASIGRILNNYGLRVSAIKIDPYINVDAGTMNPVEHGEVFVTDDGDETDQDIGNYERFLDTDILSTNYMTTGRVYQSVIEKERTMQFKGKCVQVVPHIPLEVLGRIDKAVKETKADVMIIEIGGTVGEYENILFLEAARSLKLKQPEDVLFVLVSYLPVPGHLGEMKTKPTQHAARMLNNSGLQADIIIARGKELLDDVRREKLAFFCSLRSKEDIIPAPDVKNIYEIPDNFENYNLGKIVAKKLKLKLKNRKNGDWSNFVSKMKHAKKEIKIAVVGKYFTTGNFTLSDSYISVIEAAKHAAWTCGAIAKMTWLDSEVFEKQPKKLVDLKQFDAIIVPGGFGTRGVDGILKVIQYAREKKIPYLGLCYGMQLMSIEFARNVLKLKDADTAERNPQSSNLIIHINPNQKMNVKNNRYGGTMRLGAYSCELKKGSLTEKLYGQKVISERHRHRYEFNNDYREKLDNAGLKIVGVNKEANLVEILELQKHPFFVGTQFHPELKSRPLHPHPLFVGLIKAALKGTKG